ncbi:MAG: glycosyltransferase 87 family protein [Parvularculaceae bacterium]
MRALYAGFALALAIALVALRVLAPEFTIDRPPQEQPVALAAIVIAAAGLAFAGLVVSARNSVIAARTFYALIGVGLALRVMFFGAQPILEDDWRRYLWEGAAAANGVSPFNYAPADALAFDAFGQPAAASSDPSIEKLRALGDRSASYPELVNHPYLTTIYPAPAQAAFAAAHAIAPFSLDAWRFILLLCELVSLFLLLRVLPAFGAPAQWALLYWLNPLVIVQTFSGAHMDALVVPPLLAMLWAARLGKAGLAGAALGLAVGVKLWPVLLAPLVLRRFVKDWRRAASLLASMGVVALVMLAPMLLAAFNSESGLAAYAAEWQRNAFAFDAIERLVSMFAIDSAAAARAIVVALCACAALWLAREPDHDSAHLPSRALTLVMIILVLSPTAFPWYGVWAAVFLPFAPGIGAALLAAGAAIYVLRFPNDLTGASLPFLLLGLQVAAPLAVHLLEQRRRALR